MKIKKIILITILIGILGCGADPDDLKFKTNLLEAMEISKKSNKPIFIIFTELRRSGYNEFKEDLITSELIQNKLNEEFVTVQLFVDDRNKIEKSDTLNLYKLGFSDEGKKRIEKAKNIGNINLAIEVYWLNRNSQPTHLVIDSERNILVEPFGINNGNRDLFISKLEEGLEKFNKSN